MSSDKAKPLDALVDVLHQSTRATRITNDLSKRHFGVITGIITSVEDPAEKGRLKVKLDAFRHESINEEWVYVVGAYEGVQPRQLIGCKCLIAPIEGSTHMYKIVGILDGDIGTYDSATAQGEYDQNIDNNDYAELQNRKPLSAKTGTMFRNSVYSIPAGDNVPICHAGNHGVSTVIDDGLNSYLITCLRMKGGFAWVESPRKKYDNEFRNR